MPVCSGLRCSDRQLIAGASLGGTSLDLGGLDALGGDSLILYSRSVVCCLAFQNTSLDQSELSEEDPEQSTPAQRP